jgi:hypothetical protein
MSKQYCETCRFSKARDDGHAETYMFMCRRYAPKPHPKRGDEFVETEWVWPLVLNDEWCGEYQIRVGGT